VQGQRNPPRRCSRLLNARTLNSYRSWHSGEARSQTFPRRKALQQTVRAARPGQSWGRHRSAAHRWQVTASTGPLLSARTMRSCWRARFRPRRHHCRRRWRLLANGSHASLPISRRKRVAGTSRCKCVAPSHARSKRDMDRAYGAPRAAAAGAFLEGKETATTDRSGQTFGVGASAGPVNGSPSVARRRRLTPSRGGASKSALAAGIQQPLLLDPAESLPRPDRASPCPARNARCKVLGDQGNFSSVAQVKSVGLLAGEGGMTCVQD
jgi:hypothetical protein